MHLELNFLPLEDARDFQDLLGSFCSLRGGWIYARCSTAAGKGCPGAELEIESGCSGAVVLGRSPM